MNGFARNRLVCGIRLWRMPFLLVAGFLFCASLLVAQPDDPSLPSPTPVDTTDAAPADTVAPLTAADTVPSFEPFAAVLGSFRIGREKEVYDLTKNAIPFSHYFSPYDLLRKTFPAYPLSHGAPGLVQTFSYAGADPRALAISFNGRPLNGAEGGYYNPGLYSPEFIERAEVLRGADAALYGDATSLIGLNFLQPRFNVAGSYVRLAFSQGAGTTSNADLTFSRNVASRTNLTIGVRRLSAQGLFPNQNVSFWGIRAGLTWRPVDGLTISFSELFTDLTRGANGGLTAASTLGTFIDAVNDTLDEGQLRHDMTLALQWYPGSPSGGIADSTDLRNLTRFDGALYYTHARRSLNVGDELAEFSDGLNVSVLNRDDVLGARAGAYVPLGSLALHGNLVAETTDGKAGRIHAGGMLELPVGQTLRLFGGGAVSRVTDLTTLTFFGEGRAVVADSLELRLTARGFSDNAVLDAGSSAAYSGERSRFLLEAEGTWRSGPSQFALGGFLRGVASGRVGGEDYQIMGANLSARVPIAFLVLEPELLLTVAPSADKRFPLLQGKGDLYAPLSLFQGNLIAQVGTTLEYQTPFTGSEYDYLRDVWLYPTDAGREETLFPVLDVYARGRIGSAYLKLTLSNILDVEYYSVYRYPVWGRSLQFSITWAMID